MENVIQNLFFPYDVLWLSECLRSGDICLFWHWLFNRSHSKHCFICRNTYVKTDSLNYSKLFTNALENHNNMELSSTLAQVCAPRRIGSKYYAILYKISHSNLNSQLSEMKRKFCDFQKMCLRFWNTLRTEVINRIWQWPVNCKVSLGLICFWSENLLMM